LQLALDDGLQLWRVGQGGAYVDLSFLAAEVLVDDALYWFALHVREHKRERLHLGLAVRLLCPLSRSMIPLAPRRVHTSIYHANH
jgi:hypothetical protein